MNEETMAKAVAGADFLEGDLRAMLDEAGAVEAIVVMGLLRAAVEVRRGLGELVAAVGVDADVEGGE